LFKQYGKSSAALIMQKKSFFEENTKHVNKQNKTSKVYLSQPKRKQCKNCNQILSDKIDFIKKKIGYKICTVCSHLNGEYEDTNAFCKAVYTSNDGKKYAENYDSNSLEEYNYRVSSIYMPKAEFLYTSLKNDLSNPNKLEYLDFGSGSGYFVAALNSMGLKNISGTEVSKVQVSLGNSMIGKELLTVHQLEHTNKVLAETDAKVVSLIGVLEHLQEPRKAIECIAKNPNIEYFYLSVPLFSLSVYIEMLTDDMFHRQLQGGHTHLYTEESLNYLAEEFKFDVVSQWWFGSDMIDLYRSFLLNLENKNSSEIMKENFRKIMTPIIDSVQLEIDKKHHSSEVHMLLKKIK